MAEAAGASLATGRTRFRARRLAWLPAVVVTLVLAALVLPPILAVIRTSLHGESGDVADGWTLSAYAALLNGSGLYTAGWNSLRFALLATVVSLANGGLLAWLVARSDAPFKPLATITAIVSLGTPYIIYVSAWLYLLGRTGPVNASYRWLTGEAGTAGTAVNVYSMTGMVFIEGLLWSPLVFLMLSATFRAANADMEEAARMAGATVRTTIWRISLRLAAPALAGVALFVFIRNLESFDVPVLIGTPGHISLLTSDIYLDMTRSPPLLGHASAFSVLLMLLVAVLLYFYGRLTRHADRYASVTGKGFRPRPFRLGRLGRLLGGALILLNLLIVLVLPLLAILWNSFSPFVSAMTVAGLRRMTLRHYAAVLGDAANIQIALNTVLISGVAATLAMGLMLVAAWISARRRPASGLIDQLASIPLVIPGVVLGLAMLEISLQLVPALYGTVWLVSGAFLIRYMPYGMRYCFAGVLQVHRELEEAAGVSGASAPGMLRRILLPLVSPSVIAGWLFIFLLGAKELSIAVLLAGPGSGTVSVVMFNQWSNGASGEVFAMGAIWTAVMTVVTLAMYAAGRNQGVTGEAA